MSHEIQIEGARVSVSLTERSIRFSGGFLAGTTTPAPPAELLFINPESLVAIGQFLVLQGRLWMRQDAEYREARRRMERGNA